jgi:hypothetical protein
VITEAQGTRTVSGAVRDEVARPLPEALVVIDPDSLSLRTRTDAEGRFRITGVPKGRFEVRVVRIGYRPLSRTIDVAESPVSFDVELQSVPLPLDTVAVRVARLGLYGSVATRGIALLPHEPRPLNGATVEILGAPHRTRTAADGSFSLPQLGEGAHTVLVTLDRYATRMVPVTIPADGGVTVSIVLDSSYAAYQQRDDMQMRLMGIRVRRATNPSTFISPHELDLDAKELRAALRYSPSLLSRGVRVEGYPCIFLNGKYSPDIQITDIDPFDVVGIEVYPSGTVPSLDGLVPPQLGTPCDPLLRLFPNEDVGRGRGQRVLVRARSNDHAVLVVWTRGRR